MAALPRVFDPRRQTRCPLASEFCALACHGPRFGLEGSEKGLSDETPQNVLSAADLPPPTPMDAPSQVFNPRRRTRCRLASEYYSLACYGPRFELGGPEKGLTDNTPQRELTTTQNPILLNMAVRGRIIGFRHVFFLSKHLHVMFMLWGMGNLPENTNPQTFVIPPLTFLDDTLSHIFPLHVFLLPGNSTFIRLTFEIWRSWGEGWK